MNKLEMEHEISLEDIASDIMGASPEWYEEHNLSAKDVSDIYRTVAIEIAEHMGIDIKAKQ